MTPDEARVIAAAAILAGKLNMPAPGPAASLYHIKKVGVKKYASTEIQRKRALRRYYKNRPTKP